jgi:hypothetical protein
MTLPEDEHSVSEFGSHCPDEAFGVCVGLRIQGLDLDDLDPSVGEHGVERGGELSSSVADQEPEPGCAVA